MGTKNAPSARATTIGLTGSAGAGKDTAGQLLMQHGFTTLAFADAVRAEIAEAWRIDVGMLCDRATKEWPIDALAIEHCGDPGFARALGRGGSLTRAELQMPRSPRWVMQRWGTDYRRASDAHYWTDRMAAKLEAAQRLQIAACITDVRFANEAELVRARGGRILRVHRPELPQMAADTSGHASEAPVRADDVVHNDGDLEHLRAELLRVLELAARVAA